MCNKNFPRIILIILAILLLFLGIELFLGYFFKDVVFKNPTQVSKSMQESKKNGVFIREYDIADIESFDSLYCFPFEQAWEEMAWHLELNEYNNWSIVIDSLSSHRIAFLKITDKENDFFVKDSIGHKWIMWGELTGTGTGLINGMINVSLWPMYWDSTKLSFSIYKQNSYSMREYLTPLFKFNLIRKD